MSPEHPLFSGVSDIKMSEVTPEQRKAYCLPWCESGLSRSAFAQQQGLATGSFYRWCETYIPNKKSAKNWSKVVPKKNAAVQAGRPPGSIAAGVPMRTLDMILPESGIQCRLQMEEAPLIHFIQELLHATRLVR